MREGKNNTVMLTIIGIATLLVAVVGATFAYFSAILTGNETTTTVTINSASVVSEFDGGAAITASNIYPKAEAWGEKAFTIKTTASTGQNINYAVKLIIDANDDPLQSFTLGQLKYTLEVDADNTTAGNGTTMAAVTDQTNLPVEVGSSNEIGTGTLTGAGTSTEIKHSYKLKIYFPDTGADQNEQQGRQFKAHLQVVGANIT